jgi:hypothetical protein
LNNFVNSSPLVLILRTASNHAERLQNVDDIVDTASFYTKLFGARVQKKHTFAFNTIVLEEATAQFAERFLLARICAS